MALNDILLGAGEVYMTEFTGTELPTDETIEAAASNVGHCSGGFTVNYKPDVYEVKNQYNNIVKQVITAESVTAKTGILTWDIAKLSMLSTASVTDDSTEHTKTVTFGASSNAALKNLLIRFVHTKPDGKKLRFTMIGQNAGGFALEFSAGKETTIDAELTATKVLSNFLASIVEEYAAS